MRWPAATFALGFGAGLLSLAIFLAATGRLDGRRETSGFRDGRHLIEAPPAEQAQTSPDEQSIPHPGPAEIVPEAAEAEAPPLKLPDSGSSHRSEADRIEDGPAKLLRRNVGVPIAGLRASDLHDTFAEARGSGRVHEALDIMAPRGTPVLAVDDGKVVKLFTSEQGGLTVYHFDAQEELCYYYAHLDAYAPGLAEGMLLRKGDLVGYVGSTGNAHPGAPHLHFAVFLLGPEKQWWAGTPVNPFQALVRAAKP